MDPFQKLPVETRLGILVLTKDLDTCLSLSRASPAVFKVYSHHIDYIKRRHTQNILLNDDSLIQDFMAVILFPEADVTKCTPAERVASVEKHLDTWGAKQLPNPFLTPYNREGRRSLLALYDRILLYVEDYLGKANSADACRSYRRFPSWAHPDFSQGFSQCELAECELAEEECSFDLKILTVDERRRIFKAFIRYELICKIYGPQMGAKIPVGGIHQPCCHSRMQQLKGDLRLKFYEMLETHWNFDHSPRRSIPVDDDEDDVIMPFIPEEFASDPFRYWDWHILSRYEYQIQTRRESSLLGCVREYILTCYGAIISEVLKTPLPKYWETRIYENAPKLYARRFWDVPNACSLYTDQGDMGELDFAGWSDLPFSFMASCGFDLLTNTLSGSIADFRELVLQLCGQLVHNLPYLEGTSVHAAVNYDNCTYEGIQGATWYPHDLRRLYRQRAWVVFNNPQLQNLRLPTIAEYCSIHTGYSLGGPNNQVETKERTELICHAGGYAAYPALQNRLVRCWK